MIKVRYFQGYIIILVRSYIDDTGR